MLSRPPQLARPRLRDEGGLTLPELIVAAMISMVVLGAAVTLLTASLNSQPEVSERAGEIQRARTVMEQMTREVRQGSQVFVGSATQLSLITYVDKASCGGETATTAIQCRVDYSCVSGACTRTESQPDGSGSAPGVEVVSGLSGSDVFEYSPSTVDPTYIGMTMAFPASGSEDAITLKDGVALRNPAAPSG
jgi:type II secretory pathway pseudopilin PulG